MICYCKEKYLDKNTKTCFNAINKMKIEVILLDSKLRRNSLKNFTQIRHKFECFIWMKSCLWMCKG